MKITEEELNQIALEYIEYKTPIAILAEKYGISKSSLIRYFNGERSIKLSRELQEQVDEVKQSNWIEYKSTSGNEGHKSLTDEEIKELAEKMVQYGLTLDDLVKEDGPVKSTIYNLFTISVLGEELYNKIIEQYRQNKTGRKK